MNKLIFFLAIVLLSGCSLNSNSKFWSPEENVNQEILIKENNIKQGIFKEDKVYKKDFNENLKININGKIQTNQRLINYTNNNGVNNFNSNLKKSSRYKFSKIKNFYNYEPEILFIKENIIFFNNKGTVLKFNKNSKLTWKKNIYSKSEKKLNPVLQFAGNDQYLIVADNVAKYYKIKIENGELVWSKNNIAPFNSQIKIFKDKFFIVDYSNTLRCYSIKNGEELWNIKTDNSLIRSQKKLSLVIVNNTILFNNSIGDITAVNADTGELLWQLPTQTSLVYESTFSLESSDIITDSKNLFFSNNKNQFFSIDINTGSLNWKTKINSNLRPTLIDNILLTISLEGYLFVIDKNNGNIIRSTYLFDKFKEKKRSSIKPTGFILGNKKLYLSTNIGRLLVVDFTIGRTEKVLKIDNQKILRPVISNEKLFIVKDNSIIKIY